jgi:K+-sensing histidine kinase KdpD
MRLDRAPYLLAVLAWGIAFAGTTLLWPVLDPNPFLLFLLAIMVSAWYGGLGPGLLATILSALTTNFFFLPPLYTLELDWNDLAELAVFVISAVVISSLTSARRRAEAALRETNRNLEGLVAARTADLARTADEAREARAAAESANRRRAPSWPA